MDRPPCRSPLPDLTYRQECEKASRVSHLRVKVHALRYLEDRIADNLTLVRYVLSEPNADTQDRFVSPIYASLNAFYTTCLLRYLQRAGEDIPAQHLGDFNTPDGNQVDRFLSAHFIV